MTKTTQYAGDISPQAAWEKLRANPKAKLVDVRSSAEITFVGHPDIRTLKRDFVHLPWQEYPGMQPRAEFPQDLAHAGCRAEDELLFLCRSGQRSRAAAICATQAGFIHAFNIATGFEGVLDAQGHRGVSNGWKYDGLPWCQT